MVKKMHTQKQYLKKYKCIYEKDYVQNNLSKIMYK